MKREIARPVFAVVVVVVVILIAWFGWRSTSAPGMDAEKAQLDEAEKRMAAKGIDIKTVPRWSEVWYRYHPEYKGTKPPVQMPHVDVPVPGGLPSGAPGGYTSTP